MEKIINYVEHAAMQPENRLSLAFLNDHIRVVEAYALQLGATYNAKSELLSIAALLHDISAVLDLQTLPIHAEKSAEIAEDIMLSDGYSQEDIEIVKRSIEKHSTPLQEREGTMYEVILSNADAMAQIAQPAYWMFFATQVRKLPVETALQWYKDRLESNWKALLPTAKELMNTTYDSAVTYLKNYKAHM